MDDYKTAAVQGTPRADGYIVGGLRLLAMACWTLVAASLLVAAAASVLIIAVLTRGF